MVLFLKKRPMQSLVGIRRSICGCEKWVKTGVGEAMIGWRAKKGKLRRTLQKTRRSRAAQRAAGTLVLSSIGKRAPTAPPQVSAGQKRITDTLPTADLGAPRATSTCPLRAAHRRPAPGPAGQCGSAQTAGIFLLPAHLCRGRPRLPEDRRQEQTPSREKKEAQACLVKKDFIGAPGLPRTRRPLPHAVPRFRSPRSAGRPSPAVPWAARTAHQLLR